MTGDVRAAVLAHLQKLVAFDTRNPPRAVDGAGIFAYLREQLPRDVEVELQDLGDGCVYLYARRGNPQLLVNVHVDTVPVASGWTCDPLALHVDEERAAGLGACDIKGAAAAILTALPGVTGPFSLLFSSDEEAGDSRCVRDFIARHGAPPRVLVAEPTRCSAVAVHRGIATCSGVFTGVAGHASASRALHDSALHELVRWSSKALGWAEEEEARSLAGLTGVRFNLGSVEGGTKPNMIAGGAKVRFGIRPPPGKPPLHVLDEVCALGDPSRVVWQRGFVAPPLPSPRFPLDEALDAAHRLAATLGLSTGNPVDFWTEAALFSDAGSTSLVYGPGDIAQAHAPGEWVRIEELIRASHDFARILGAGF